MIVNERLRFIVESFLLIPELFFHCFCFNILQDPFWLLRGRVAS